MVRNVLATPLDWVARSWVSIAFAIGFFGLWEASVRVFEVPRYIVPARSVIFYQFFRNLPRIWEYTLVTGGETLAGFAVAILIGVPLALEAGFQPAGADVLYSPSVISEEARCEDRCRPAQPRPAGTRRRGGRLRAPGGRRPVEL